MKLHFLGTCSGTEPLPGRHHTSLAIETRGRLYFLDAGESCSRSAHLGGLDLLATRAVFISHTHMDHIGGLANLIWTVRKLVRVTKRPAETDVLRVYLPSAPVGQAVETLLDHSEGYLHELCRAEMTSYAQGLVFDDGDLRVTAFPNTHVQPVDGHPLSYSFLVECEGRRVVYSGDVKRYDELDGAVGEGCDLLIGETGHHKIDDVYAYFRTKKIGRFCLIHHGREILDDPAGAAEKIGALFGGRAALMNDGDVLEL